MEKDVNSLIAVLKNNRLFQSLTDTQLAQIAELVEVVTADQHECIIQEGDPARDVYVLMEGEVRIVKQEPGQSIVHQLAVLRRGESIGEVSLLDNQPRSASVIANKPCVLMKMSLVDLARLSGSEESIRSKMTISLAHEMGKRLRETNENTVDLLKKELNAARDRVAIGSFLCNILVVSSLYVFLLGLISNVALLKSYHYPTSFAVLSLTALLTLALMLRSGNTPAFYGLTLKNWRRASYEGIVYTLPIMVIVVIYKWLSNSFSATAVPIFSFGGNVQVDAHPVVILGGYMCYAIMQEVIARGGMQSAFQYFLTGENKTWKAILLANLLFSITHLSLSPLLVIIAFFPGLFWGWLYSRHHSLIGVCISHILLGIFIFYVVGFPNLVY